MDAPRGARVGLDLVEVERFREALARHPGLKERLFTPTEIGYCEQRGDPILSYAARFAAKEAVGKLLETGVTGWHDIEVGGVEEARAPRVRLQGRAAAVAAALGVADIGISLTHSDSMAGACALTVAEYPDEVRTGGGVDVLVRAAVFTPAQVRELDRATIEDLGVPGPVLMERAAWGITALVRRRYPDRHALIVCGPGNNGGDGLAAARQLHVAGHPVACVVYAGSVTELSPDAALNYRIAERSGVNLRIGEIPEYLWQETELVVDCLLGTGATGELRGRMVEAARLVNGAGARGIPVLAVDMPSGVDAATGSLAAGAVAADITITFHAAKSGLVCPPGSEAAGEVVVWDIGIPESMEPQPDLWVVTADDVNVPGRRVDDHKYRAGYVAVLAGSTSYPGAAWLATQAAYKVGAGYVRLLMPAGAAAGVRDRLVEGVLQEIGPGEHLCDATLVLEALSDERLSAAAIGPGLGREAETVAAVRRVVLESKVPAILDADGLYAFAGQTEALRERPDLVLTPHLGELATLLAVPLDGVGCLAPGRGAPRGRGHGSGGALEGLVDRDSGARR